VWRAETGECLQSIEHPGCVWDVAWLPSGDLATACSDASARLWSSAQERQVRRVLAPGDRGDLVACPGPPPPGRTSALLLATPARPARRPPAGCRALAHITGPRRRHPAAAARCSRPGPQRTPPAAGRRRSSGRVPGCAVRAQGRDGGERLGGRRR
jgi:hypothetical protein